MEYIIIRYRSSKTIGLGNSLEEIKNVRQHRLLN